VGLFSLLIIQSQNRWRGNILLLTWKPSRQTNVCIKTKTKINTKSNIKAVVCDKRQKIHVWYHNKLPYPTASSQQNPSWEAGSFSDGNEILPTVHYPVHKRPIYPIHNLPLYVSMTDFGFLLLQGYRPVSPLRIFPPKTCMNFSSILYSIVGRDSVVRIVTCYGLDGQGIESRWDGVFPHLSRPSLVPTQPPMQWLRDHSSV